MRAQPKIQPLWALIWRPLQPDIPLFAHLTQSSESEVLIGGDTLPENRQRPRKLTSGTHFSCHMQADHWGSPGK